MRDSYARAKRNLRSKDKSGISAKALRTPKLKMEEFKYFQWLEEFIKPRQSKSNVICSVDDIDEGNEDAGESFDPDEKEVRQRILDVIGEEEDEAEKDEEMLGQSSLLNSAASQVPNTKKAAIETPRDGQKSAKKKRKQVSDGDAVEKEELALLRTIANAVQDTEEENDFDLFAQYIAKKMKKLSARLDEDAMANIEYKVTTILNKARTTQQPVPQEQPYYFMPLRPYMQSLRDNNT